MVSIFSIIDSRAALNHFFSQPFKINLLRYNEIFLQILMSKTFTKKTKKWSLNNFILIFGIFPWTGRDFFHSLSFIGSIINNLDKERYITREKCIEWCGKNNSWLASIDDSVTIKKKNYTGRFFNDKKRFSETDMVS